ncbi:type II toxin-antitoxin system RelE/ParE family toxin [Candidatus Woesebacteria bacterium]|nr:type II toxin-antitoxin system RelE/ParE family toxin [Candidatus Woesebacteria bacterium]
MRYKVYIYPITEHPDIIEGFLSKLQKSSIQKITRQLRYLEEYGLTPEVIDLKKLKGYEFWEVRILGKENIRIFVWGYDQSIFVIHIFKKKSQATKSKELDLAKHRLKLVKKMIDR